MSIKCAEIYFSNSGSFTFMCTLCKENFLKAIILAEHLIDNHFFSIYPDALKSPFLIADNELENIRELFANKKEIAVEELSNDIDKDVIQNIEFEFNKLQHPGENLKIANSEPIESIEKETISDSEKTQLDNSNLNNLVDSTDIPETALETDTVTTVINELEPKIRVQNANLLKRTNKIYWKCHLCNKVMRKASRCRHMDMHQFKEYKFPCKTCNEIFSTYSKLQHHIRIHTGGPERPYECKQCDNKYKINAHLREHIKRAHLKLRNFKCNFCDKAFYGNNEARRHEISWHSQPKPNICEICGLSFTTTQQFKNHQRRHDEPKFECKECGKKFHVKRSLTIHEICHKDYKPYQCKVCLQRFPRYKSYTRHLVLHTGVKDYICKLCGKAFAQASGIRCHMKSHCIKYNACNVIRKSRVDNENT